jgi:hypothetical protein
MRRSAQQAFNRPWYLDESNALSETELIKLAFLRDIKHLGFFLPAGIMFYWIAGNFEMAGKILGWMGVSIFVYFALQGLLDFVKCFVSLVEIPVVVKNIFWKLVKLFISFANLSIYAALAFLIYAGMYKVELLRYIPWA